MPAFMQKSLSGYSHLGRLDLVAALAPLLILLLLLGISLWIRKRQWRHRLPAYAILGIVAGRILLWGNPGSWYVYYTTLGHEDIGFRQGTVMADRVSRYFEPSSSLKYLAIGSSQTGAVYSRYAKENEALYKVQFSGMGPVEYYLYRDIVDWLEPEYVLLYLSEFDLARPLNYDTFRYVPQQGFSLLDYRQMILSYDKSEAAGNAIKEIVLGNFSPEYRYSFIYKGYLKKALGYNSVYSANIEPATPSREAEIEANQARGLRKLSEDHIPLSLAGLDRFIDYCNERGTKVVIVEGQYKPNALTPKNRRLRALSKARLVDLAKRYPRAFYLPSDRLPVLQETDYSDYNHVFLDVGKQYAGQIIRYIEENLTSPP